MSALKVKIVLLAALAALAAAVLIPAGFASPSKSSSTTVGVQRSTLGRILVDAKGRTLYLFMKDRRGKSSCYGACAAAWPPLIASGKLHARSGAKASLLGATKRKDGRRQVTYKGHPLYRFVQDTKKGQTNGEGVDAFGAEWFVVSPAGAKIVKAASNSGGGAPPGY
jgi:predicted lipoprotein with Yx(FWY)xxD motif